MLQKYSFFYLTLKYMELNKILPLLGTMILLAMTPDTSVIAVMGRSLYSGFKSGFVTVLGLLCGDLIFILIAIYGLSHVAQRIDYIFVMIKYLGGAYLIYLGGQLFVSKVKTIEIESIKNNQTSWQNDFLCGLLITLSDPKAIFFYISFLPAFVDLSQISIIDVGLIFLCAILAVGGAKLIYAGLANIMLNLLRVSKFHQIINYLASLAMIFTGLILFFSN